MVLNKEKNIVITGGAGLVGQNLVTVLQNNEYSHVIVLDKHQGNLEILKQNYPHISAVYADLAIAGDWQQHIAHADIVVMLQAQIGGMIYEEFQRNTLESTGLILETMKVHNVPYLIHISSSVVKSRANDFYTHTKKEQERMVLESGLHCSILRPTLMFGWFDRKHLGWLSRFMKKVPLFPIPGWGQYIRQPLYVRDFCNIIMRCITEGIYNDIYNISGHEHINYIDMIREIKRVTKAGTLLLPIPYKLFYSLLWLWGLVDKNPPFTTQQLAALVAKDDFEIIDWPSLFHVSYTPFNKAIEETFNTLPYSATVLEF